MDLFYLDGYQDQGQNQVIPLISSEITEELFGKKFTENLRQYHSQMSDSLYIIGETNLVDTK